MKRWLTVSNVLATIALMCALTGTSYAAIIITGKNVKNNSLTGEDIKNKGLYTEAFSSASISQLKSTKGPTGDPGNQGALGNVGSKGSKGDKGSAAPRAFSYIKADDNNDYMGDIRSNPGANASDGCLQHNISDQPNPDPALSVCTVEAFPNWNFDCATGTNNHQHMCSIDPSVNTINVPLGSSWQPVLKFTSGQSNGGYLTLARPGNLVIIANVVLHHVQGDPHTRIACQAETRNPAVSQTFDPVGKPVTASADLSQKVVNLTVTGGIHYGSSHAPGNFDFQVKCKELDDDNGPDTADDWRIIRGNVNAVSTEQ